MSTRWLSHCLRILLPAAFVLGLAAPAPAAESEAFRKAEDFFKAGKFEMALLFYNKELAQNPDNAAAYHHRGRILLNNGDFTSAAGDLRRAAEIDPKNPDIPYFQGLAEAGRTNAAEAVAAFARVPKKGKFYPDSFLYAGIVWLNLRHDATNTIRCYEKYLELRPENDQADQIRRQIECLRDPDCFAQALAAMAARLGGPGAAGGPGTSSTNMSNQSQNTNQLKLEDLFMPDIQGESTKSGVSKQKGSEDKKSIQTE